MTSPIGGPSGLRPDLATDLDAGPAASGEAPAAQAPPAAVSRIPTSAPRPGPAAGAVAASQVGGPPGARRPEETVRDFYEAFTHLRWNEVERLYAKDLSYKDPLFEHKSGAAAIHMWKTLFQADELKMGYEVTGVEGNVVKGRWTADYTFNGRPVHEVSESRFLVKDGKIVSHQDDFSVVAWAKQAFPLGPLEPFADTTLGRAVITRLMRFGIKLAEEKLRRAEG
jgi:hypothetical protein